VREGKMSLSKEKLEKYVSLSLTDKNAPQSILDEHEGDAKALLYVAEYILENEHRANFFKEFSDRDKKSAVKSLLKHRCRYLNNKFSWTEPDKHRFLYVNENLLKACETAWNEAFATALQLEERMKQNVSLVWDETMKTIEEYERRLKICDPFLRDYEIDVSINPYPKFGPPFNEDEDDLGYLLDYFAGLLLTDMSISHSHFEYRTEAKDWHLLNIDKTYNWNENIRHVLKDDYICHAMHSLLGTRIWSYEDILSIDSIWSDVKVVHQNFVPL